LLAFGGEKASPLAWSRQLDKVIKDLSLKNDLQEATLLGFIDSRSVGNFLEKDFFFPPFSPPHPGVVRAPFPEGGAFGAWGAKLLDYV
jgi:hypothetical protein